jgi:sigma-B regulation protein RsbU (phosphoserine phosphatase)
VSGKGDFTSKIAVVEKDQLGELSESFNQMTASIEDLLRQAAEKKRLEEELRHRPRDSDVAPAAGPAQNAGPVGHGTLRPRSRSRRRLLRLLPLDESRVGVLIADVSGKGTSAALYMAELKGLMLSLSLIHSSPRAC